MDWIEAVFFGWILGFVVPKSIVFPIYRGMYRSMRATEARDAEDAAWLAAWEAERRRDGGDPVRRRRRRGGPPSPRRPGGPGPLRHARRERTPPRSGPRVSR